VIQAEVGQLPVDARPIDLCRFVADLKDRMAGSPGIERLRVECATDLPSISADPSHLERILSNLISNALKFSPADREVLLEAKLGSAGEVVVGVHDRGPGIPAEDIPRVFERYFRRPDTSYVEGLGLHIARMLAEAQGARIEVQSEPGQGSTFRVVFPVAG
jgi:signal transduction histidine kinase